MSQNLRVALWVPQADPLGVGNSIRTAAPPTANKRVLSEFAVISGGGSGGGVDFADNAEVAAGTVANEAISPATLRTEMMREFSMPFGQFANAITTIASAGVASANKLVKTDSNGLLDASLLTLDGGTF